MYWLLSVLVTIIIYVLVIITYVLVIIVRSKMNGSNKDNKTIMTEAFLLNRTLIVSLVSVTLFPLDRYTGLQKSLDRRVKNSFFLLKRTF